MASVGKQASNRLEMPIDLSVLSVESSGKEMKGQHHDQIESILIALLLFLDVDEKKKTALITMLNHVRIP